MRIKPALKKILGKIKRKLNLLITATIGALAIALSKYILALLK